MIDHNLFLTLSMLARTFLSAGRSMSVANSRISSSVTGSLFSITKSLPHACVKMQALILLLLFSHAVFEKTTLRLLLGL